jgi:hypothetical protein
MIIDEYNLNVDTKYKIDTSFGNLTYLGQSSSGSIDLHHFRQLNGTDIVGRFDTNGNFFVVKIGEAADFRLRSSINEDTIMGGKKRNKLKKTRKTKKTRKSS